MAQNQSYQKQSNTQNEQSLTVDPSSDPNYKFYEAAQKDLLASIFKAPDKVLDVVAALQPEDFDNPQYRNIFSAISLLAQDVGERGHVEINLGSVVGSLAKMGLLEASGGMAKVMALMSDADVAYSVSTIDIYVNVIRDIATKYRVRKVYNDSLANLSIDSGVLARDSIEMAQRELSNLATRLNNSKMAMNFNEYYGEFLEDTEERRRIFKETGGDAMQAARGIPTGFPTLDKHLRGWQPGNTIIVGARTGVGKSVCAVDFALAAASAGASVLFFSMEMTEQEVATRLVSSLTGVFISKIQSGNLSDSEMAQLKDAWSKVKSLNIRVDTEQNASMQYIRSEASRLAKSPTGLDLIIIDYLGLIKYQGAMKADKQNQVAEISRELKELAMTMQIPIIILAQLDNRLRGDEAEQEPTLAHIRESGAIANDSNVIILLHRKKDDTREPYEIPTKFIIEKNRNGSKGAFKCHSFLFCSRFVEIPEQAPSTDVEKLQAEWSDEPIFSQKQADSAQTAGNQANSTNSNSFSRNNNGGKGRTPSSRAVEAANIANLAANPTMVLDTPVSSENTSKNEVSGASSNTIFDAWAGLNDPNNSSNNSSSFNGSSGGSPNGGSGGSGSQNGGISPKQGFIDPFEHPNIAEPSSNSFNFDDNSMLGADFSQDLT